MEICFVDNITKRLLDVLNPALSIANRARLAVAFVKQSGLSLIGEALLNCLERGSEVEFLLGLDFRTTDPEALKALRQLSDRGLPIKCYCFSDPSTGDTPVYHPKLYFLIHDQTALISIGSSNLTSGGLKGNVEVNAVITADLKEEIVSDIYGLYNQLKFQKRRFEPTWEYIAGYEQAYRRVQRQSLLAWQERETRQIIRDLRKKEATLPQPIPSEADLFGWQGLVYGKLPLGMFQTSDMYIHEQEFQNQYPQNKNIQAKVRQVLQQLRDMKLIKHLGKGRWERL